MIHFTAAFAAIEAATRAHNATEPLANQIRAPHVLLLQELVKITAAHRNRVKPMNPTLWPPMRTNNIRLAEVLHIHPRTVQRLIQRLAAAGMLTKRFRGSKADYEIEVNHTLLGIGCLTALPQAPQESDTWAEAAQVAANRSWAVIQAKATSCPHTVARTINKTVITAVEKPKTEIGVLQGTVGFSGSVKCQEPLLPETKDARQKGANLEGRKTAARPGENLSRAALAHIISLVSGLWLFTERHLYARAKYLTNSQRVIGQAYFIGLFLETPRDQWEILRNQLLTRLYVVDDWLQKDEGRYIPIPRKYFDPDNPTGFTKTARWVEKMNQDTAQLQRYRERFEMDNRIYTTYRKAVRHYIADPNSIERYREALLKVGRVSPELVAEFQQVVVDIQTGRLKAA